MKRKVHIRPEYDRAVFEVLHAIRGRSALSISKLCYVSPGTISKWRRGHKYGGTRYPQHHTLAAVAKVAGLKWILVDDKARDGRNERRSARVQELR